MSTATLLVTGAHGCIGAQVVAQALKRGMNVVAGDLPGASLHRLHYAMTPEQLGKVKLRELDVRDLVGIKAAIRQEKVTHVVHLAGLQTPACQKDPILGINVNVLGTANVYQAVLEAKGQIRGLSVASSVAAGNGDGGYPQTLYGTFKKCAEGIGWNYATHFGVSSVQLEPYIVAGVGRDDGLTSGITKALLAAAAKQPYTIGFDGPFILQPVGMVAKMFLDSVIAPVMGFQVCNVGGRTMTVENFVHHLRGQWLDAQIDWKRGNGLPYPCNSDRTALERLIGPVDEPSLETFMVTTFAEFQLLVEAGKVDLAQLKH